MPFINVPEDTVKVVVTRKDGTIETYRAQVSIDFVKDENGTWSVPQESKTIDYDDPEGVGNYRG